MWLRVTVGPPLGASVVKSPPRRIFPSGWTTTTSTNPLAFGSNPSSADCPFEDKGTSITTSNQINRILCTPTLVEYPNKKTKKFYLLVSPSPFEQRLPPVWVIDV